MRAAIVSILAASAFTVTARAQAPSPIMPRHLDKPTIEMIERGLDWLKNTQRPDGSWSGTGGYGSSYPAVMTGLAGLALMSNGSTPTEGKYSENVRRAMNFLIDCAEKNRLTRNGVEMCVVSSPTGQEASSMYGHGFAMLFLAQCFGCELDQRTAMRLRKVLEQAGRLCTASQSAAGGWYYSPNSGGDEGSVTVTQMQAMRAARDAGIKIDKATIDRAIGYIEKSECRNADGTSGIAYMASMAGRGGGNPPITAAAVVVLYSGGKYDSPIAKRCFEFVKRRTGPNDQNVFGGHYFYSHMYVSQAMYQAGGRDWDDYYPRMRDRLKGMQGPDGSWNGDGVGNTYGTAIACLILQLPYGYLPIFQR